MIGLLELLRTRGFDSPSNTKMVRHEDPRYPVERLRSEGQLEYYQGYQSRPIFEGCDYIVSFLGQKYKRAILFGVFRVDGRSSCKSRQTPSDLKYPEWAAPTSFWYDLTPVPGFEDLIDRVIIDWGTSTRSWHQWLRDREVVEILPRGYVREFPGYLDFVLTYEELKALAANPVANREWHRMLSAISGVYLIVDQHSGMQYVGSACGEGGIMQRWIAYANRGHGDNKLLRELFEADERYSRHLTFTLLQTLPRTATQAEVIDCEQLHKRKLGSRAHGLNAN